MEGDKEKRNKFDKKRGEYFGDFKILPTFASANERICILVRLQEFFLK